MTFFLSTCKSQLVYIKNIWMHEKKWLKNTVLTSDNVKPFPDPRQTQNSTILSVPDSATILTGSDI